MGDLVVFGATGFVGRLVATLRGGFSGGTIDSMRAQIDAVRSDPAARRTVSDPFALSPDRSTEPATRLPSPGSGPSEQTREQGFFRMETTASTTSGRRYRAVAAAPGDLGYTATAVMLAEAALALACDDLPPRAGSLTPATAFGPVLADRLRAAGHSYQVTEV